MKKIYSVVVLLILFCTATSQVASDINGNWELSSGRLFNMQISTGQSSWASQGTFSSPCGNSFYFDPSYPFFKDIVYAGNNKWNAKDRYYCSPDCYFFYKNVELSLENSNQRLKVTLIEGNFPCGSTPATVSYYDRSTATAIHEKSEERHDIDVYPNPTVGNIVIHSRKGGSVEIFNCTGQIIFDRNIGAGPNDVNLNELPKGIYNIKIQESEDVYYKKIVVE